MAKDTEKRTLNDVDRFYIDNNPTMTLRELSQKLKIQTETIKRHRESRDTKHVAPSNVRKVGFKQQGQALVMTAEASELSDVPFKPKVDTSCIFRPFDENRDRDPMG